MKLAAGIAAYLAALLAVDTQVGLGVQLGLGALTWLVLLALLTRFPAERRAQALGVVLFATVGEVTGSILWGVYHYRLHNLPMFVPPAHGLVYLAGLSLATALAARTRALVLAAAAIASGWALLGLTVLPREDVAGAIGVPLLLLFLWRSRSRGIYAAVFLVVAVPRAVRDRDRDVALGARAAGPRDPGRQPAERRRLGLRLVRRDGAADRALARVATARRLRGIEAKDELRLLDAPDGAIQRPGRAVVLVGQHEEPAPAGEA